MTLHSSERDAPVVRPDEISASPAKSPPVITVDCEAYAHLLDDPALSESDKRELLQALWSIICSFVQLGFGVHPAQQACGKLLETPPKPALTAPDMVSCPMDNNDIGANHRQEEAHP